LSIGRRARGDLPPPVDREGPGIWRRDNCLFSWRPRVTEPFNKHAIKALRALSGTDLANAIEFFDRRLRNEGFTDPSIRCLVADARPAVGYAVTARIRCSSPPPVGHRYHDRTDWWNYIVSVPAPRFVVVQDIDERPGLGAFIGDVHANILRALGAVAYATNGSVRDVDAVSPIPFTLFATSIAVSHAFSHIVDFGGRVDIGGLPVASGDLLFGDRHGVQSVPLDLVESLPAVAANLRARDQAVIRLCQSQEFAIDKLRTLVRSLG
jgi:regulator of RNase E activity RraA